MGHNLDSSQMSMDEILDQENHDPDARGSTDPAPVPMALALPAPVVGGEELHLAGTTKSAYRLLDGPVLTTSSNAKPLALDAFADHVQSVANWKEVRCAKLFLFSFENHARGDELLGIFKEREFTVYGVNIVQLPGGGHKCTALCERPAAQTKSRMQPIDGFAATDIYIFKLPRKLVNDNLIGIYTAWLASGISTKANFVTRTNIPPPPRGASLLWRELELRWKCFTMDAVEAEIMDA